MNMTDQVAGGGILMSVDNLALSTLGTQSERRKHFSKEGLQGLANSIKAVGMLQPILVRSNDGDKLTIVAGERRFLAAKLAGLAEVPVTIRDLDDTEVLEIQLIENLQREGLHELTEAEGYERLIDDHGLSIEDVVAKVGKSRSYVFARLKLLDLCPEARKAFYAKEILASVALLLARIPDPALQRKALKDVSSGPDGGLSYRAAAELVRDEYMLRLADAPFPTADATLVPEAGACGPCPMRTGSQPELFADVKGADICTNQKCFAAKRAAWTKRELARAAKDGQQIIDGAEAKKLIPNQWGQDTRPSATSGYVALDDHCYQDPKKRTYRQLLGKDGPKPAILVNPHNRDIVEVVKMSAIKPLLKQEGVRSHEPASGLDKMEKGRRDKAKRESAFRFALMALIREKLPTALGKAELLQVAARMFDTGLGFDARKAFRQARGWALPNNLHNVSDGEKHLQGLDAKELAQILIEFTLADDLVVSQYSIGKPLQLLAAAKRAGIDAAKFRKQFEAAQKAPAKKPAAAKPQKSAKRK